VAQDAPKAGLGVKRLDAADCGKPYCVYNVKPMEKQMQTTYQLNADDLNEDFLEGLKTTFKHKEIEIVVYERDETAYLLSSPANRSRLLEAIADVEQDRNIVVPDQEQFQ
jgi:antitoxin YefM